MTQEGNTGMEWGSIGLFAGMVLVAVMMAAWVSALVGVGFVRVHTETEIEAPTEIVWDVVTDFARYPEWNPLMVEVRATPKPDQRMEWTSVINGSPKGYNATIGCVEPERELGWTGPVSSPMRALFWGHHRLIIEKTAGGRVRFVNSERFGGLLSIALQGFLTNDIRKAYDAQNAALKARAEALATRR